MVKGEVSSATAGCFPRTDMPNYSSSAIDGHRLAMSLLFVPSCPLHPQRSVGSSHPIIQSQTIYSCAPINLATIVRAFIQPSSPEQSSFHPAIHTYIPARTQQYEPRIVATDPWTQK